MSAMTISWDVRSRWLSRQTALTLALAFAATWLVSRWEHSADPTAAVDRSLSFVHCVVLPLLAFAFVRQTANGESLRQFAAPLVRHGKNRRAAVLWALLPVSAGLLVVALLLAWLALGLTHGLRGPHLLADIMATTPIACLTALVYVAWLSAAATWGATGAGALWALLYDWVLGSLPLPIAWITPRGHVRHLLGFEVASGLPQWASFPALAGLGLLASFVLVWRVPR